MKRILAVVLSVMLMANLFAGCSTNKKDTNVSTSDNGMVNGTNKNLDDQNMSDRSTASQKTRMS